MPGSSAGQKNAPSCTSTWAAQTRTTKCLAETRTPAVSSMRSPLISMIIEMLLTGSQRFDIRRNMEKPDTIAALAALAQENRLDVFRLLVRAGPEGLSAGA